MLALNNIEVVYDGVILVLKGVSLTVEEGRITTLLGANGAGKTTTFKAISGLLRTERGEVTKGTVELDGDRLDRLAPHDVVRRGVAQVFEGRRVFENLTVEENLVAGAHIRRDFNRVREAIDGIFDTFPVLKERRHQASGYLSGGEQQMLVIGRALMCEPKVILLDEPSLGLAPLLVAEIFGIIRRLREERGLTVLLVEQNAALALDIADHGYVMENGRIVLEGPAEALAPEFRHQGILPRSQRGRRPQIVSRPQTLPAPQTLAVVSAAEEATAHRWETAYRYAITGGVPRRSFWVAVIVGSVLNLINQGDQIISGQSLDLAKLALTYLVPYFVSTVWSCVVPAPGGPARSNEPDLISGGANWRRARRRHSPASR